MNVKRIDEKLCKAIMMAYQYQINCELTPSQCKELIDYINNPLELEEVCEWVGRTKCKGRVDEYYQYKSPHDPPHYHNIIGNLDDRKTYIYCHVCGKRIVYKESEE